MLGFVGLGAMGSGMAANLLRAGHDVLAYDTRPEAITGVAETLRRNSSTASCEPKGHAATHGELKAAGSAREVAESCDRLFFSLPHPEVFAAVLDESVLPHARPGFRLVDLGTSSIRDTRRFASLLRESGAELLDVPVSGGAGGAAAGTLRMFAGGDRAVFDELLPLLRVLGDPERIVYCGDSGMGQVVKVANQLIQGLSNAAALEAVALAYKHGVGVGTIDSALGGESGYRALVSRTCRAVENGTAESIGVKFGQLENFTREAADAGIDLPLASAVRDYLWGAELVTVEANRPSPSFWRELNAGERGRVVGGAGGRPSTTGSARQHSARGIEQLVGSPICLRKLPLSEIAHRFAGVGLRRIEAFVGGFPMSVDFAAKPDAYRRLAEKNGLVYSSMHLPPVAAGDPSSLVAAQRCLGFAAAVGAPIALLKAETPEDYPEAAAGLLDLAERFGITLVLQNHAGTALQTPDDILGVLRAVGDARLKVLFEVGHFERVGVSWPNALDALLEGSGEIEGRGSRVGFYGPIAYCHIKDFDEHGNSVALGTGRIDFGSLFERLHRGGYRGGYVIEIEGDPDRPTEEILSEVQVSIRNLTPILERL